MGMLMDLQQDYPGSLYHRLPNNHLQFKKHSFLKFLFQLRNGKNKIRKEQDKKYQETTYVDIVITKLCKAAIHHRISDLSNYVFVYIAGEMIPTIPPHLWSSTKAILQSGSPHHRRHRRPLRPDRYHPRREQEEEKSSEGGLLFHDKEVGR